MAVTSSAPYGAEVNHSGGNDQNSSAYAKAKAINASIGTVKASTHEVVTARDYAIGANIWLTINGIGVLANYDTTVFGVNQAVASINNWAASTGVFASTSGSGLITFTAVDGRNINIVGSTNSWFTTGTTRGAITLDSTNDIRITGSSVIGHASTITADNGNLTSVDLSTRTNAQTAMDRADAALAQVLQARADFGSLQTRFETSASMLSSLSDSLKQARARIVDLDYALETAVLTRQQILQQASSSILAQASISPRIALQLLIR